MPIQSPSRRVARAFGGARFEVAGNGFEQFATGCEVALPAGDEVLETTDQRTGLCVAAHFQHVGSSAWIFRFSVESHCRRRCATAPRSGNADDA